MKQRLHFVALTLLLSLAGCANPYQVARSTVTIGRGALTATGVGFSTYMQVEKAKCLDKCKQDKVCYDACMKNPNELYAKWDQSRELARVAFDTADTSIAVAEKVRRNR
jgi:GH24 family phage-related lysozyme (muramidase)